MLCLYTERKREKEKVGRGGGRCYTHIHWGAPVFICISRWPQRSFWSLWNLYRRDSSTGKRRTINTCNFKIRIPLTLAFVTTAFTYLHWPRTHNHMPDTAFILVIKTGSMCVNILCTKIHTGSFCEPKTHCFWLFTQYLEQMQSWRAL